MARFSNLEPSANYGLSGTPLVLIKIYTYYRIINMFLSDLDNFNLVVQSNFDSLIT